MGGERALCVDTDALVSLLALDAFDVGLHCLGVTRSDCFCLRAAKHQISKATWILENWPFFDRDKAGAIVSGLKPLPQPPSLDLLDALNIDGIDEGEAYFLAALTDNPEYVLLSGDRRMLEALHGSADSRLIGVREAVRGRVVFFIQVVAAVVKELSLREVENRVRSGLCRHRTLKTLFGSRRPTKPDDFWEAYESELRSYLALCGEDWLFPLGDSLPPGTGRHSGDSRPPQAR